MSRLLLLAFSIALGSAVSIGNAQTANRCSSIMDNGGNNTGTANNDTAFTTTAALGPAGHSCVFFPPGKYSFASTVNTSLNPSAASISVVGSGTEVTQLVWSSNGGLQFNYNAAYQSVHVQNLSILGGSSNAGSGIGLFGSTSSSGVTGTTDITNVTIRGADGFVATDYWVNGVYVSGVSQIDFTGVSIWGSSSAQGNGVVLQSTSSNPGVTYNFSSVQMSYLSTGITYGNYIQGVTISQSNFGADGIGVVVPSGESGLDQLTITASQFNGTTGGIVISSYVPATHISSNLFIVDQGSYGIQLLSSGLFSVIGNTFIGSGGGQTSGGSVVVGGNVGSYPGVISGNVFALNCASCQNVWLQSTSSHVNLQSNVYYGTTYINAGSANTIGGGSY